MKKALCVLAVLTLAAAASADVRVFVTSSSAGYGLNETANAFIPTFSTVDVPGNTLNAYDFYHSNLGSHPDGHGFSVSNFPPQDAPSGTVGSPVQIPVGNFGYIWFQFQAEAKGANVNGLKVLITDVGGPTVIQTTYYVQNDLSGDVLLKRWDGTATAPDYPEWNNLDGRNLQILVGVHAAGLTNGASAPWDMFLHQSGAGTNPFTGVGLLGAVQGQLGHTYTVSIDQVNYSSGTPGALSGGAFQFAPEPASLVLMALAGLLLRRR